MQTVVPHAGEKPSAIETPDISIRLLVVEPEPMRRKCAQQQLQRHAVPTILRTLHFPTDLAGAWREISRMSSPYDCIMFGQDYSLPDFGDADLLASIVRPGMDVIQSMALTATEKNPDVRCLLCIHDNAMPPTPLADSRIRSIQASKHAYAGAWNADTGTLLRGVHTTQPVLDYIKALRFLGFFNNSRLAVE